MKTRFSLALVLFAAAAVHATVNVGDTYQQVIAQKGPPGAKMEMGETMVLRYSDETVRLKAGKVVAVESAQNRTASAVKTASDTASPSRAEPSPAKPAAGKASWKTDYAAAMAEAKEQNRRVFVFFTGSDWCGWCMRLNKEILATSEFARYAGEKLVLLEVDFPHGKSQSSALKKQNETLAGRFQIEGFPTVVVLDPNGRTVGRLGYQEGGPGPFVARLKKM